MWSAEYYIATGKMVWDETPYVRNRALLDGEMITHADRSYVVVGVRVNGAERILYYDLEEVRI